MWSTEAQIRTKRTKNNTRAGNVTPVEAGATATLPRYPELLRRPHELASAEKSDFTELGRYSEPEQFVDCNERIEQEHLPIGQSEL